MSYLALDKWARVIRMTIQNGGLFKSLYKIWRMDTLKEGKYIGCDEFGNKYYENKNYMLGRSRWVEYNPQFKWDYDASQVTPEWFGWLHYKTDRLPSEDCAKLCLKCCCWTHRWRLPHTENMSATERAYYPFRTTRTHISVWDGRSICNRPCFPL
ncbi:probable NADH dehydrogenase [ubiquinone] 1 alpha subcomplex subunit 12 [Bombyx mandarina]|uniref:NADH dehydrogenase [ubiquinone] 1 alpha subcomplex subunit 12 n=2 Tax=Bombyx TaxID=7090 RepID=A0A8R1WLC7_BOMMO|nr:probable NADH dehydrogenase [ubiquinone] 1 alpha subcomplex subunit 12 [Bombyx mori]XP_028032928.1 probable NADH dehydrogenase [ubiquinone] 1 alpha subcomplex subunit 12 [Bombyx mandarina]